MTDTLVLAACIIALIASFAVLVCVKRKDQKTALTPAYVVLKIKCEDLSPIKVVSSHAAANMNFEIIGDPKQPSGMHTL